MFSGVGRDCKTANTAILKSTDGGVNRNNANYDPNTPNNDDNDRQGTPLAINPLNPYELYIGTRDKRLYGYWISPGNVHII